MADEHVFALTVEASGEVTHPEPEPAQPEPEEDEQ